jgi:hypothetical protein
MKISSIEDSNKMSALAATIPQDYRQPVHEFDDVDSTPTDCAISEHVPSSRFGSCEMDNEPPSSVWTIRASTAVRIGWY